MMLDQLKVLGWFAKDLHDNEPVMVHGVSLAALLFAVYRLNTAFNWYPLTSEQQAAITGVAILIAGWWTRSKVSPAA